MMNTKRVSNKLKIEEDDHYPATVSNRADIRVIGILNNKLTDRQKSLFKKTCLGHLLQLEEESKYPGILVHWVLLQEVKTEGCQDELWFFIDGKLTRFGKEEFSLVSGLSIGEVPNHKAMMEKLGNRLRDKFIGYRTLEEFKKQFLEYDFSAMNDSDSVKLALVLVVHYLLLAHRPRSVLEDWVVKLADNVRMFNKYQWGNVSWAPTISCMRGVAQSKVAAYKLNRGANPSWKGEKYNLYGFPWAFQAWIYEAIPLMARVYCRPPAEHKIPRMLKWQPKKMVTWQNLHEVLRGKELQVIQKLEPIEEEMDQNYVASLLEWRQSEGDVQEIFDDVREHSTSRPHAQHKGKSKMDHPTYSTPPRTEVPEAAHVREITLEDVMEKMQILQAGQETLSKDLLHFKKEMKDDLANVRCDIFALSELVRLYLFDRKGEPSQEATSVDEEVEIPEHMEGPRETFSKYGRPYRPGPSIHTPFTDPLKKRTYIRRKKRTASVVQSEASTDTVAFNEWLSSGTDIISLSGNVVGQKFFTDLLSGWLEDIHIDEYLHVIRQRYLTDESGSQRCTIMPSSFFVALTAIYHENASRMVFYQWDDSILAFASGQHSMVRGGKPWKDVDMVYLPINIKSNHWVAGRIDLLNGRITVLDSSIGGYSEDTMMEELLPFSIALPFFLYGCEFWQHRPEVRCQMNPFEVVRPVDGVPQQKANSGDCGVFVCKYIEYCLLGKPCDFDSSHGPAFRQDMAVQLWKSKQ